MSRLIAVFTFSLSLTQCIGTPVYANNLGNFAPRVHMIRVNLDSSSSSIASELQLHGITSQLVNSLGKMADMLGYGIDKSVITSFPQRQGIASAMLQVCLDIKHGRSTWSKELLSDISQGALQADAKKMNGYLKLYFCPKVH